MIKDYKMFLESNEYIDSICKEYIIMDYTINKDGTVDVDGNVNLYRKGLTELPLKFGKVTGDFNCLGNQLTSLEGSPYWVGKDFNCTGNLLKTLESGPKVVIGDYFCRNNKLINFKGFPEDFDRNIDFSYNPVHKSLLFNNVPYEKWTKFIYWCNELNVIDDEGNINEEWLEEVHHQIGIM